MEREVYSKLAPVRRRQRIQFSFRVVAYCLLVAASVGIAAGLWRLLATESPTLLPLLAAMIGIPALGLLAGIVWRRSWNTAASAVDRHYDLKDRTTTALEFLGKRDGTPWKDLQIADAASHLESVDARAVVPFRVPSTVPYAVAVLAAAVVLLVWPRESSELSAKLQEPLPGILTVADEIDEDLNRMEDFADEEQNEELKALVEQLREDVEEMRKPEIDVREALAKLSEMQAAVAQQQAAYNETLVDAQLKSLGAAMAAADSLNAAAGELQEGDFEQAAQQLEKLEKVELERREARSASEKMKKVARSMSEAGLGQLSGSVSDAADGLESGNAGKTSKGFRGLARHVRKHQVRKKVNSLLARQLMRFSECKSSCQACQSGMCAVCGGNCQGGQCNKNSLAEGLNPNKSTRPSNSFGKGTSGNINGDKTNLAGQRNLQEITGMAGDGPTEFETTTSPEGREQARRTYREVYEEYQKLSEAVLDSEPIPLGHRQTIRRYFELIRPENADLNNSAETDGAEDTK